MRLVFNAAIPALAFVSIALSAHNADAFVRTLTCTESGIYECGDGEQPKELFWPSQCVNYHINSSGTEDLDYDQSTETIISAFDAWNDVECSSFTMNFVGETDEDRIGYNPSTGRAGNANVMVFRDTAWAHGRDVLALTSVTFQSTSGEIFDADIEFNTSRYTFTTTNNPLLVQIDLLNTATHEAGHFLGLDHSANPDATMASTAPSGETSKRTLEDDDKNGLCDAYPSTDPLPEGTLCAGGPAGFFERPAAGPDDDVPPDTRVTECGCRVYAPTSSWSFSALGLLALLLGSVVLHRRRSS